MKKLTRKNIEDFVINKLTTDKNWQVKALLAIYNRQTDDEKTTKSLHKINYVGFTGFDAEILTSFAERILKHGKNSLSNAQMKVLANRIKKYHRQIIEISDYNKLEKLVHAYIQNK